MSAGGDAERRAARRMQARASASVMLGVEAGLDDADAQARRRRGAPASPRSALRMTSLVLGAVSARLVGEVAGDLEAVAGHARHAARAAEQLHAARRRVRAGSARRCRRCAGPSAALGVRAPRLRASARGSSAAASSPQLQQHRHAALACAAAPRGARRQRPRVRRAGRRRAGRAPTAARARAPAPRRSATSGRASAPGAGRRLRSR